MATPEMSGTAEISLDFADIAEEAYELIGLEARTGYDLMRARRSLNIMLAEWMNRGINLWSLAKVSVPLHCVKMPIYLDPADEDIVTAIVRRNGQDYPLHRSTRDDYMAIPHKEQCGRPSELYVERGRMTSVYLWPVSDNESDQFISYRLRRLQSTDSNSGGVDVPHVFYSALTFGLAFHLAMKAAPERAEGIKMLYEETLHRAINENSERGSMMIYPARSC